MTNTKLQTNYAFWKYNTDNNMCSIFDSPETKTCTPCGTGILGGKTNKPTQKCGMCSSGCECP